MRQKKQSTKGKCAGKVQRLSGWKTILFNGSVGFLVLTLQVFEYLGQFPWPEILPPKEASWVALILGLVNIVLRHWTSGPAGWRKDGEA